MPPDSLQAAHPVVVNWMPTLFEGLIGALAAGGIGWFAAARVQKRGGRESQEAVVRRLLAAAGTIRKLRMARQQLHDAEAQNDIQAIVAVFQGAEYLLSPDDGDRLAAAVGGGAEQLKQPCYNAWLHVQTAAKEATKKYEQIRGLTALLIPGAILVHHVGVYRGLVQDAITQFEAALRVTAPFAASDSGPTLAQLLAGDD